MMNPSFEDEEAVNPFDLWNGANFRLRVRKVDGWTNYDKSEFDSPGPLFDDDDKMEEVYNQEHSLQELLDEKNFKSYDELKTKFLRVIGKASSQPATRNKSKDEDLPWNDDVSTSSFKEEMAPEFNSSDSVLDEDDDGLDMDFFKDLTEDD